MDLQGFVDMIEPMSCIISVEREPDGGCGDIRIVAANRAYIESIENTDTVSSSQMLHNKFIPDVSYEEYIPKDLNFEDACYRCAILKKPFHTYIHPDRYSFWIDLYMTPLMSDEADKGYLVYTQEFTMAENIERMSNISASISSAVLKTCFKLKGSNDFPKMIDEVVSDVRELCAADRCNILLTDYNTREFSVLSYCVAPGIEMTPLEERLRQAYDDFFDIIDTWQDTIAGSTCLIIKNEQDMAVLRERNPVWQASLETAAIDSLVLFPLTYNDEILGYIWVVNFATENAAKIKETLELTAHLIASEIANFRIMNRLKEMGTVDMLTGVMNRNAMNNRIDHFKEPDRFGIIMADLNGLKQKNDSEGHVAGDQLLKDAAAVLSEVFYDAEIYRAGGDEFLIIAPDALEDELEARVEKLRRESESPDHISFALGLYYDGGEGDIVKAMHIADERMYEDKERYYAQFPERRHR